MKKKPDLRIFSYPSIKKLIMELKIAFIIALVSVTNVLATSSYSQSAKVSLDMQEKSLEYVMDDIEKQSEFYFVFNQKQIDVSRVINIQANNKLIDDILPELFDGTDVNYVILDRKILLTTDPIESRLLNSTSGTKAQQLKITGTVTDASTGEPLPGVNIQIEGTFQGVITDATGYYSINVADQNAVLIFSYIGYLTEKISVTGKTIIDLALSADIQQLEEVVVVGYGTQKKVNLTGSLSTVSNEQLVNRPITNVASALQGTMAGVTVLQNSGKPGDDFGTIRIRGVGTLNNADAMIVVDGVVVPNMNSINMDDIESITVLKDAASSAIYGSRAANGVILITTKKGKAGKVTAHYNYYFGKQSPTRLAEFLPSWQAASLYNEARINEGGTARFTEAEIQKFKDGSDPDNYANTDWIDLLFSSGSGLQQNHFFDVSGGTEKTQAYFSMGYFDQKGIIKNLGEKRYTGTLKVSSQIGSRLKVNGNVSYWTNRNEEPTNPYRSGIVEDYTDNGFAEYIGMAYRISNMVPYKYSNGYYGYVLNQGNPMAWLESGQQTKRATDNIKAIVDADLEIVKDLHFKPRIGYNTIFWQEKNFAQDIQYYNHVTGEPTFYSGPTRLRDRSRHEYRVMLESLLQYDKSIGSHDFSILAGYSQEYFKLSTLSATRQNYLNHSISELNAGPQLGLDNSGSAADLALRSYFGRLNYSFMDRYLLEANIRYDGSSRFHPENRWGVFPSFSAGWRVSEEKFFAPLKNVVTQLKFRGSWGMLGNQEINNYYPTYEVISAETPPEVSGSGYQYSFGGIVSSGVAPFRGADRSVTWETTTSTNVALDAALYNGKFTLTAEYFHRMTNDILTRLPVSFLYGQIVPYVNAAKVRNTGFEFVLGYHGNISDFKYDITGNATFLKNSVRELKVPREIFGTTFWEVPYPIDSYYGYQTDGLFQTTDEIAEAPVQPGDYTPQLGDIRYKDQLTIDSDGDGVFDESDGKIDGDDRVYLGTFFPKTNYGLTLSMEWKGFDLMIFFQGAAGVKGFIRNEMFGNLSEGAIGKPTSLFNDRWTPQNTNADFPRLWINDNHNDPNQYPSDFWVRDADYLRLKQLSFGYTLKPQFLVKAGIQSLRLYYSGTNLLTFSKFYDWVDPEAVSRGADGGRSYPMVRTNTIGINVTF